MQKYRPKHTLSYEMKDGLNAGYGYGKPPVFTMPIKSDIFEYFKNIDAKPESNNANNANTSTSSYIPSFNNNLLSNDIDLTTIGIIIAVSIGGIFIINKMKSK